INGRVDDGDSKHTSNNKAIGIYFNKDHIEDDQQDEETRLAQNLDDSEQGFDSYGLSNSKSSTLNAECDDMSLCSFIKDSKWVDGIPWAKFTELRQLLREEYSITLPSLC